MQLCLRKSFDKQHKLSDTYPVHSAEVDRLSKVEALIEATVVGSRKRDDKLTSTLVCSVNLKDSRDKRQ